MPNQNKINLVEKSTVKFKEATGIYFAKYTGMNVIQVTEFRKMCRENNVNYEVTKNSLTKIAAKNAGYENIFDNILQGQIGIVTSIEDPIAPARIIKNFNKNNGDLIDVVGLYVDGNLYDPDKYLALANLPTRNELIAQFSSILNQPMTKIALTLNGIITKFAQILENLKEQKN